jgi:uncharacterized protein YndB with AHSA1/START domain
VSLGTRPEWSGPRDTTTIVDQMDVRPGGSRRFVIRNSDGSEGMNESHARLDELLERLAAR